MAARASDDIGKEVLTPLVVDEPAGEHDRDEREGDRHVRTWERDSREGGPAEELDHAHQRIERVDGLKPGGDELERIDDRREKEQHLQEKRHELLDISVAHRYRAEPETDPE